MTNKESRVKPPEPAEIDSGNTEQNILTSRACALDILEKVLTFRQALDLALENSVNFNALDSRDRAFVRMLVSTTLRRLGQIDDLILRAQERPDSLRTPIIRHILRLGTCQLFFMDVPSHAAVDTSVSLANTGNLEKQKGFINALLRNLDRKGREWVKLQDPARLNTPEWLLKIWIDDYGLGTAAQIATANIGEAALDISIKDPKDRPYWGNTLKASELSTGTLRRMAGGNVREMEGYDEGKWWIQDAASAIPANLFGNIQGQTVIDLCAAPGGKTLQLAAMGASVIAVDRSAKRLLRLEENLNRMALSDKVDICTSDASIWKPKQGKVSYILLDAPCSATGTTRRHPDTPHLKTPKDLEGLISIQTRLLEHSISILSPGGKLIYCTCSLQKDEGERQIDSILRKYPSVHRLPVTAEEVGGHKEFIDENGDLRILPFHLSAQGGIDGFFVSRLTIL